jgi:hypothetical protein
MQQQHPLCKEQVHRREKTQIISRMRMKKCNSDSTVEATRFMKRKVRKKLQGWVILNGKK